MMLSPHPYNPEKLLELHGLVRSYFWRSYMNNEGKPVTNNLLTAWANDIEQYFNHQWEQLGLPDKLGNSQFELKYHAFGTNHLELIMPYWFERALENASEWEDEKIANQPL